MVIGIQFDYDLVASAPGATQAAATPMVVGSAYQPVTLPGSFDPTYAMYRQEFDGHEGWYSFTATKNGLMYIAASGLVYSGASIGVFQGDDLMGARWNSGGVAYLLQPVVRGGAYTVRIWTPAYNGPTVSVSCAIASAVSTFVTPTNVAPYHTGPYWVISAAGDTYDVRYAPPGFISGLDELPLVTFDLPGAAIPAETPIDQYTLYGVMADVQFEIWGRDTSATRGAAVPGNDGMAFAFMTPNFSNSVWYWPYGMPYKPAEERKRWISLRNGAGSPVYDPQQVVDGHIPGESGAYGTDFGLDRYYFVNQVGQGYEAKMDGRTGLRVWWWVPDDERVVRQYPRDDGEKMSTSPRSYPVSGARRIVGGFR